MKYLTTSLLLLALAACSGGPLKELPVFEPPPEEPATPPPIPPATPEPEPEEIYGAWSSTSLRGPGSAAFTRVWVAFERDGSFAEAAFGEGRSTARAGRFMLLDGAVQVDLQDGAERVWLWTLEDGALVLRSGESEIRFVRLR